MHPFWFLLPGASVGLTALAAVGAARGEEKRLLDWQDNRLTLLSPRLPGGKVEIWYLEAFCRTGSTHRRWEETTLPHRTVRLDGSGPATRIRLKTTVAGGVEVLHDLRVVKEGVRFDLRLTNTGREAVDVDWAQPCLQVATFTGRTQETYLDRCFIFTDRAADHGLTRLDAMPRSEEAVYRGGQVYVPAGVNHADVNPRPISPITPANGLIGCFSADGRMLLAMAWDRTQELFQGVITCIHADFRIGGLRPGETQTLHGRLYLLDNDIPRLLRLYHRDFPASAVPKGRSETSAPPPSASPIPRGLEPYFAPPPEVAHQYGDYRSPLLFDNGARVQSAAEWPRRRAEILRDWETLMGPWPAVLPRPGLSVLRESRRENFVQKRVRLEIAPNQTVEGWLLVPDGRRPMPAGLVVFYEPETGAGLNPKQPSCDFGLQLARRGFVTLSIGTPGGDARKPDTGAAVCQPLSFHAYVAANAWQALAHLPEVDGDRIGIVGHSYGGKWALFAGALWEKFAAVAVSDPGIVFDETRPNVNYWEPWYLGLDPAVQRPQAGLPSPDNPRTGAYKRLIEQGRDLQELHALLAPRPFFISGGSEDPPSRWTALNHLADVNRLLGYTDRVAMTTRREHTPDEASNALLCAFFEHFLQDARP
jgi:dienelactone hydrolase